MDSIKTNEGFDSLRRYFKISFSVSFDRKDALENLLGKVGAAPDLLFEDHLDEGGGGVLGVDGCFLCLSAHDLVVFIRIFDIN